MGRGVGVFMVFSCFLNFSGFPMVFYFSLVAQWFLFTLFPGFYRFVKCFPMGFPRFIFGCSMLRLSVLLSFPCVLSYHFL